jgi:hypothetical protein
MATDDTTRAFSAAVGSGGGNQADIVSGTLTQGKFDMRENPKTGQRPMHFLQNGTPTTIMNPRRSDPKVEAVLGKKEYKVKARPASFDAQNIRIAELENQLKTMMTLMAGAIGKQEAPQEAPQTTEDSRSYRDIQAAAKELSIPANQPKETLLAAIKEAEAIGNSEA